jgi:hypothetical protein
MGTQSNRVQKRHRRKAYLKRKKAGLKKKPTAAAAPAA